MIEFAATLGAEVPVGRGRCVVLGWPFDYALATVLLPECGEQIAGSAVIAFRDGRDYSFFGLVEIHLLTQAVVSCEDGGYRGRIFFVEFYRHVGFCVYC